MKFKSKGILILMCSAFFVFLTFCYSSTSDAAKPVKKDKAVKSEAAKSEAMETWSKPNAVFDANKMGDMSGWDPANWVNPEGDTIKLAVFFPHSGPAAANGDLGWACVSFAAYDINQRGGIFVDGKKKKIAIYKA